MSWVHRSSAVSAVDQIARDRDHRLSLIYELRLHYKENAVGECRRGRPLAAAEGHVSCRPRVGNEASVEHATWRDVKWPDGYIKRIHVQGLWTSQSMIGLPRRKICPSVVRNRTFPFAPFIPPVVHVAT